MAINYKTVGWDTTKFVNPTNMNQMDNGIKAACDGVDAINIELPNFLPKTDSAVSIQTADGAANRLMTQAYKGTKTTNDGRMYVQADYNNKNVIVGILGLGEVGVNKAKCDKDGNQIDTTYAKLSASSERYKKNIKSVTDERVNNLMDIDIITFDYIDSVGEGRKDNVGMLAEQIADKIPEAVVYAEVEGEMVPDKIDYAKFVPYLLAKIQMMQKEIDELKTR